MGLEEEKKLFFKDKNDFKTLVNSKIPKKAC